MKYEWQYQFTSKSLLISEEKKFLTEVGNIGALKTDLTGMVIIRPDKEKLVDGSTSGTLAISLPLELDNGTRLAHKIAKEVGQRLSFEYGDFNISWAVLACERIAETDDEAREIGENTHILLNIHLKTVPDKIDLNAFLKKGSELKGYNPILTSLFNDAEKKENIIDRYLTRFKIIEAEYIDNKSREPAKKQLKSVSQLYAIFCQITGSKNNKIKFTEFIDNIVDTRGKCAHLKKYKYGYLPNDPELKKVEILEDFLREFCKVLIKGT